MKQLWERVVAGRDTALLGATLGDPPSGLDVLVLRVSCDRPHRALGPALDMRDKIEALLGEGGGARRAPSHNSWLRRRVLATSPEPERGRAIAEVYNRLGALEPRPCALVFEDIDRADGATIQLLTHFVERPGWLRVALVFVSQSPRRGGVAERLFEALEGVGGGSSVLVAEAEEGGPPPEPVGEELPDVRPEVLKVLRAGALVGATFDADLVAELLGLEELRVLELLQEALDLGVPLADRGEGRFRLAEPLVPALLAGVTPSLTHAWHRQLAQILLERNGPAAAAPRPSPGVAPQPAPETAARKVERESAPESEQPKGSWEIPIEVVGSTDPDSGDAARAAEHLEGAGELWAAAERYLAAARDAAAVGAPVQAVSYSRRALTLLDQIPGSEKKRLLKVRILAELGRHQWQAAGPDVGFTLQGALAPLRDALSLLERDDPPRLRAAIRSLIAGVTYDMGDARALDTALEMLAEATRILQGAGDPVGAARLLNDQAEVLVRMGDPVQAAHLLRESRRIFEARAQEDPVTQVELAETNHLLARLPLHVASRPGYEKEAVASGLKHAHEAEATYRALEDHWELARVWETLGRLELKGGSWDKAVEHLTRAVEQQQELGDVIGLARTTAALSEALRERGEFARAVGLLGTSVQLNLDKGAPVGLAYNRRSLDQLVKALPPREGRELQRVIEQIYQHIESGEAIFGRAQVGPYP